MAAPVGPGRNLRETASDATILPSFKGPDADSVDRYLSLQRLSRIGQEFLDSARRTAMALDLTIPPPLLGVVGEAPRPSSRPPSSIPPLPRASGPRGRCRGPAPGARRGPGPRAAVGAACGAPVVRAGRSGSRPDR